jgi:trigger factor
VVAPIDDTLAEKLGFDTLADLRTTLASMRQRRLDGLTRMRLKRDLLDVLAEAATFAAPQVLVDQEFEQIWKNLESSRASGTLDEEDKQKTDDQLRADYRTIADRRVRLGLLLGEIGRVNNIVVTPEEVTAAIRAEAAKYPGREAQMIEFYRNYPAATDSLRGPIFEDKVVDYVLDAAQITDAAVSIADLEQDPAEPKPAEAAADASSEAAAEPAQGDSGEAAPAAAAEGDAAGTQPAG